MVINFFKILGLLLLIMVTIALMLPPVTRGREAARRTQCKNNLKQIRLALATYESIYDVLPPAHTVDANGNPLHSWRTLILPYIDQQNLYQKIDLSKPWNDPANAEAYNSFVPIFWCPSTHHPESKGTGRSNRSNQTTYMAVVTPNSCLHSTEPGELADIKDRHQDTLMLIEVPPESAVHWMAPVDADEKMVLSFKAHPKHPHNGGTHSVLVDGQVRFLSASLTPDTIRALISIAGHESVDTF